MTRSDRGSRQPFHVKLTPLSNNEWRVSDLREPWDSPHALIGFIGKTADSYEVLEFGDPVRSVLVSSMDEAISVFTRHALSIVEKPIERAPDFPPSPGTRAMTAPEFSAVRL
jgi:hypothetical protein